MENLEANYKKLMDKVRDLFIFQSTMCIIHWDMETMMPPKAINLRSQQLALLSKTEHKMITDPEIGRLLEEIMHSQHYEDLNYVQKRNIHLIKKQYDEQTRIPEELVATIAKQRAITTDAWKKAKAAKNFAIFKPELEKLVELEKKTAEILMEVKRTKTPYDALIDIYEPKMDSETICKIFSELKENLVLLLNKCISSPKKPDASILQRKISIDVQRRIAKELAKTVLYDTESDMAGGRIDETEHPFTTGYYDDVRITTHYYEDNFASSIFSVLHEAGHAMYEQNLNPEWIYQPVGTACSSGFHESQSRFLENIIGRSREFWAYFLPKLKEAAGAVLEDVDVDSFVHAINEVHPSKIRVEADEVTYCLHIIIRFNIEKSLFAEKLTVKELPEVWNQSYKDYLGLTIENDSEGVMQDTHWASGMFGYFPSYALGNIYSGQILTEMEKKLADWREQIGKGNFFPIKNWLINNVHRYGNLHDHAELIKKITGTNLTVEPYIRYLKEKYSELYRF